MGTLTNIIQIMILGLLAPVWLLSGPATADDGPKHAQVGWFQETRPNLDVGIEYGELEQNHFRELGANNFSFVVGQRFTTPKWNRFGWRVMAFRVDLDPAHLANPNEVCCITGNRQDLTGQLEAFRAYLDYTPASLDLIYVRPIQEHAISIKPVFSAGLGYHRWIHTNTAFDETHDVRALTVGGAVRLRTELFGWVFVETPNLDFAVLPIKSASPRATIGDTTLDRPEYFALTAFTTVGVFVHW